MKKIALTVLATAALLAPAAPAMAGSHPDQAQGPKQVSKAKAYGKYCKGQSKKRTEGEKGTAFSRCVTAMARADRNENLGAREACKTLSKKRVEGTKGTPFSRCVVGVAQMRKED